MSIPFVDLSAQHQEIRGEIEAAIKEVIDQSSFIGGLYVDRFERSFADYCGTNFAVACASGTDALKLALMSAGVCQGEEVVTVPHTFIATVEAITSIGAYPVFVDIELDSYTLSCHRLDHFLRKECRVGKEGRLLNKNSNRPVSAVLPVHLYGLVANIERILTLAEEFNLKVIEDAAQAHGAGFCLNGREKTAGTFGRTAAFSFYPGKNLGAMGEAGAVVTDDSELDKKMRVWRDHGQGERYVHVSPDGWNGRLDALQCAVLDLKLKKLEEWNERRRRAANWYQERLKDEACVVLPSEPVGRKHVYHLFVIRVPDRERIRSALSQQGISTGLHYPIPLHLQPAYKPFGWKRGDFPESERAAESILSLPMFPHITQEQVDYVCHTLKELLP